MRRISKAEPGCYIVDLKMLLLSLEFPELDGVPVLQEVEKVDVANDSISSSCLMTTAKAQYTYWPVIPNVQSFDKHTPVTKDLCVGQLIGLLQFQIIPRHPVKGVASGHKALNWALTQGTWKTAQYQTNQTSLAKRQREPEVVRLDD